MPGAKLGRMDRLLQWRSGDESGTLVVKDLNQKVTRMRLDSKVIVHTAAWPNDLSMHLGQFSS